MEILVLTAMLILAAVFAVSAFAKLTNVERFRQTLLDFGVAATLAKPFSWLLSIAEAVTAAALLSIQFIWWGGIAALALLLLFIGAIAVNLARGKQPDCNCFGQLHSAPISAATILRNLILAALALFIIAQGSQSGASLMSFLRSLTNAERIILIIGIAVAVLLTLIAIFLKQMLTQQQALFHRLEALESRLHHNANEEEESVTERDDFRAPAQRLPIGSPAPDFSLSSLNGETATLADLLMPQKPLLLLFFSAGCTPCATLLPEIEKWQQQHSRQLQLAIITKGTTEENRRKFASSRLQTILVQEEAEVTDAYKAQWTPGAVLINPDGTTASKIAYGGKAIREMVMSHINGERQFQTVLDSKPELRLYRPTPMPIGNTVPPLALSDTEGNLHNLGDLQGEATLLVFWSPDCGYCRMMAADLNAIAANLPARIARILVISRGSREANLELNLQAPILLDEEMKAMSLFGSMGTPSAVIIDAYGRLASSVAIGASEIFSLVGVKRETSASSANAEQKI